MAGQPRWFDESGDRSAWYVERFRRLAAEGADLAGEARLVDALVAPVSRILDAGCGTGRVAAALAERGHAVVGVDVDPVLIAAAAADHPGPAWVLADLAELDLPATGFAEPFDAAVLAGNVMTYLAEGSEQEVLARVAAHVRPDGIVAVGFGLDRGLALADFDAAVSSSLLVLEHRFASWDLRPFSAGSSFAVSLLRRHGAAEPEAAGVALRRLPLSR
ncbi:MAG TPA: class I SAM-dependent methyltransferase [Acidimicrobiales bacterium]|nr:class I SAM-dependent methyltransferase [Acidimicrobiales bacterium]